MGGLDWSTTQGEQRVLQALGRDENPARSLEQALLWGGDGAESLLLLC